MFDGNTPLLEVLNDSKLFGYVTTFDGSENKFAFYLSTNVIAFKTAKPTLSGLISEIEAQNLTFASIS